MQELNLVKHFKSLKLTKNYVYLSILYGFSTLLIPFAVQLLVNNLSLTGLWVSTASFLLIIAIGLLLSILVKYGQFILVEYLQRQLLHGQLTNWIEKNKKKPKSPYFFEMFALLKSFSSLCIEGVDFLLTTSFGLLAIAFIHPAFFVISTLVCVSIYIMRQVGKGAIKSSIEVSNKKYDIYYNLSEENPEKQQNLIYDYFESRASFFQLHRNQALVIFVAYFVLQMMLLIWGIHLIELSQLSIGQLVSAEIISSNIFVSLVKLPKIIKGFYDFETSAYKIEYAITDED